jgi:hypothetical protein
MSVLINNSADTSAKNPQDAADTGSDLNGDYIRIVTLNPRGLLLSNDSFFNSGGVRAHKMIPPEGPQRIIIGETDMLYQQEVKGQADPIIHRSLDGWVIQSVPTESFEDPCIPK